MTLVHFGHIKVIIDAIVLQQSPSDQPRIPPHECIGLRGSVGGFPVRSVLSPPRVGVRIPRWPELFGRRPVRRQWSHIGWRSSRVVGRNAFHIHIGSHTLHVGRHPWRYIRRDGPSQREPLLPASSSPGRWPCSPSTLYRLREILVEGVGIERWRALVTVGARDREVILELWHEVTTRTDHGAPRHHLLKINGCSTERWFWGSLFYSN